MARPDDRVGQRGGASLVTLAMTDSSPPYALTGSFGDGGATGGPGPMQERDRRICSFLAGPQFGLPALPGGSAGGTPSLRGVSVVAPAAQDPQVQICGAAPGMSPEAELLRTPSPAESPQSRNAGPDASRSGLSMAELDMVLKTVQRVGELPKPELGGSAARNRGLKQWLRQVARSLEPAGNAATSWWQWPCNSANAAHRVFLATALDQQETVLPQGECRPSTR